MRFIFALLLFLSVTFGQVNDKNFKEKINGGVVVAVFTSEWQEQELDEKILKGVEGYQDCEIIYVLATVTTQNKNLISKKLLNKMKPKSVFVLMSRAAIVNFVDLKKRIKKGDIYVATDAFPEEPVKKNDPIRKLKNILFSAHRAGALEQAFFEMGDIVLKDMNLILKKMPPKFCKRAQRKTVNLLASKPVAIN